MRTTASEDRPGLPEVLHVVWLPAAGLAWWVEDARGPRPAADLPRLARERPVGPALRRALTAPARPVALLLPGRDGRPLPSPDAVARIPLPRVPAGRRNGLPVQLVRVEVACAVPDVAASLTTLVEPVRGLRPGREVAALARVVAALAAVAATSAHAPAPAGGAPAPSGGAPSAWLSAHAATLPAVLRCALLPDGCPQDAETVLLDLAAWATTTPRC